MTGEMLDAVVPMLMRDEGFRRLPYRCSAGHLTIGYGTNLDAGLDDDEAMFLLEHRINKAIAACLSTFPWFAALEGVRSQVLVMMVYQLGIHGVTQFRHMVAALEQGDFAAAADAMLDSKWARADTPARAYRLATAMRRGEWVW
jgi:lysozyme